MTKKPNIEPMDDQGTKTELSGFSIRMTIEWHDGLESSSSSAPDQLAGTFKEGLKRVRPLPWDWDLVNTAGRPLDLASAP